MDLKIYAVGGIFNQTSELKGVVDLLKNYEEGFDSALKRACYTKGLSHRDFDVRLRIAKAGTLNVELVTEVAAVAAPFAPHVFGYAWQLYHAAYKLVMIANKHFRENGRSVNIQISDSPGATVNVAGHDFVQTNGDVYEVARSIHEKLDNIAQLVKMHRADSVALTAETKDAEVLEFNRKNQDDFRVLDRDTMEGEPIELECNIYRFNKKSQKGYLEYEEDGKNILKPFTLEPGLLSQCLDAIRFTRIKASVFREVTTNALGEKKIKRFHIVAITQIHDE